MILTLKLSNGNRELENTYINLENTLNGIYDRVLHIINKANSETMKKERKKKYESFSFIQLEWEKSINIWLEIESIANNMLRDLQADSLIHLMLDTNIKIKSDLCEENKLSEESNYCEYSTVPDEIYGKSYEIVDLSVQSVSFIQKFEDKINDINDILDTRDKVYITIEIFKEIS